MKTVLGFLFLLMLMTGCVGQRATSQGPVIAIAYYPFEESMVRLSGSPEPNYMTWDDQRIHHDLVRLTTADVDLILLNIKPADFRNRARMAAYERFIDLVGTYRGLQVAMSGDCMDASSGEIRELVSWLVNGDVTRTKGYFYWDGRPLLVLRDAEEAEGLRHPELTIRHTLYGHEWQREVPISASEVELSPNGEQVLVTAGLYNDPVYGAERGWAVPRLRGDMLQAQLRAAMQVNPQIICIESWNDFRHGSFLESSSMDGERPYLILEQEISRIRDIGRIQNLLEKQ